MEGERPEYPETKRARWKALLCFIAAFIAPELLKSAGQPEMAPYAFAALLVAAAVFYLSVELDRLHRRVDGLNDGH